MCPATFATGIRLTLMFWTHSLTNVCRMQASLHDNVKLKCYSSIHTTIFLRGYNYMRSSFFEFHVATSAMNTARQGSRVVAHNMANVSTAGFSRQVTVQQASTPLATNNRTGMIGTGSEVIGINQIRNAQLDHRFWNERPMLGVHHARTNQLTLVQNTLGELDGLGINGSFERFFDGLQSLSTDPSNPTIRNNFIQSVNSLTRSINERANMLLRQQQDINREVGGMVAMINTKGAQIANLNNQIERQEVRGDRANDLRDQRALLIDQLSALVNVTVSESTVNGQERLSIHIDGQQFVSHTNKSSLAVVRRETPLHPLDVGGLYDITIGGRPFNKDSATLTGELRGLLEVRDGNSQRNPDGTLVNSGNGFNGIPFKGIPYYISRLNHLVQTVANAFNFGTDAHGDPIPGNIDANGNPIGHVGGFRPDGTPSGIPLFTWNTSMDPRPVGWDDPSHPNYDPSLADPLNTNNINIFNFTINPDILNNQNLLATSMQSSGSGGQSDASLINAFVAIRNHPSLFREGTINDFITSVVSELAMDLQDAVNFERSQSEVMGIVQNQRLQVKGVDMEEETFNMIFFQHHFQAASRLITSINEIYDNLINRMGV